MVNLSQLTIHRSIEPGVVVDLPFLGDAPLQAGLVRRITAGNGGPMTGPGTNTYLLGRRQVAVIDPGPADEAHIAAILAQAGGDIRWILVTHTHPDHSPAAKLLAEHTGAELIGCVMTDDGHQDTSFVVDKNLEHGQRLQTDEFTLEAIATPGHVANHFCFWLPQQKLLFAGDHIMQGSTVVIIPPAGDMADYVASMALLKDYEIETIAPAHGHLMGGARRVFDTLIEHRQVREERVLATLLRVGQSSLDNLVAEVYSDIDPALYKVAKLSLWAHLLKLERESKARKRVEQHWLYGDEIWSCIGTT